MLEQYLKKVREEGQSANPLFNLLGIHVLEISQDYAKLSLTAKPELMQGAGQLAGGIIATILDEAMAHAVLGGNAPHDITTTVDMNISYYRPVSNGEKLTCTGRITKRGQRVVFAEATLQSESYDIAVSKGTFLIIQPN